MKLFANGASPDDALPSVKDHPAVQACAKRVRELAAREHALDRRVQAIQTGVPLEWLDQLDAMQQERDRIQVTPDQTRKGAPPAKRLQALDVELTALRERINRRSIAYGHTRHDPTRQAAELAIDREARELAGVAVAEPVAQDAGDPERELAVVRRALELARAEEEAARAAAVDALRPAAVEGYRRILKELVDVTVKTGALADRLAEYERRVQEAAGPRARVLRTTPFTSAQLTIPQSRVNLFLDDVLQTHGLDVDVPRARRGHNVQG